MKISHLLIVAAVVVLLAAGFLRTGKLSQAQGDRAAPAAPEPARAAKAGSPAREQCRKKCSALHKGFVYRARQNAEPEYCGCI